VRVKALAIGTLVLAGCGGYIGSGQPPKAATTRTASVQVSVGGDEPQTVERALAWVTGAASSVKRVSAGGDRKLRLDGKLVLTRFVLGTDAAFTLRVSPAPGEAGESRTFEKKSINGNLRNEIEKLVTTAVLWALEWPVDGNGHAWSPEAPRTTAPLTTAPLTTAPLTTAPLTTAPLTTAPLTTAPPTASALTTAPPTASALTTAAPAASPPTASPPTLRRPATAPAGARTITPPPARAAKLTPPPARAAKHRPHRRR
jgi:hypothetical protein